MPIALQDARLSRAGRLAWLLAAGVGAVCLLLPLPARHFGFHGLLALAGAVAVAVCAMLHPLAPFALYFGALFFADTAIPGLGVSANQVLGLFFIVSAAATRFRGTALTLRSTFLPLLALLSLWLAASAITGQDFERGIVHFRYPLLYFGLAVCLAWSLRTEGSILALAWIVTVLTFIAGAAALADALHRDIFSGFTGKWTSAVRVRGAAKNSIVFGWNMVYGFPFAFLLFSELRTAAPRFAAMGMGLASLFIAILTFNRQTFLAIGLVIVLCAVLFRYRNRAAYLGAVLVAAAGASLGVLPMIVARFTTVAGLGRDISFLERHDSFLIGMEMFRAHPFTGVGLGSYPAVWREYLPAGSTTHFAQYWYSGFEKYPDQGYLQLLAETGLPGLVLFAAVMAFIFLRAWKLRAAAAARGDRFAFNLLSMILVLASFVALTTLIQDTALYVRVWILFALSILLDARIILRATPEPDAPAEEQP